MPLNTQVSPLVQNRKYGVSISDITERLRAKDPATAQAFASLANAVNDIYRSIAQPSEVTEFTVDDPNTGAQIAWIGAQVVGNMSYSGAAFANLWVGPGANPATAPFFSNGSQVVIGKNGQIFIQDSGENTVGWFGVTQQSPKTITSATNASPAVVTINAHGYVNGDTVIVAGATGNTAINGYRIVQGVTANTFTMTDLAGAAINGNGAYAGTATATRYYAGVLAQTFAIGPDFTNYKLRAFADGTLKIQDATITVVHAGVTVSIDPTHGGILVTSSVGTTEIDAASTTWTATGGHPSATADFESFSINDILGDLTAWLDASTGLRLYNGGVLKVTISNTGSIDVAGEVNTASVFKVAGTQVVGPRLSAITAPTVTTSGVAQTAGATYTANEQNMLASLKAAVLALNSDVTSLQTAVNTIRDRLATGTGHGLTS